MNESPVDTERPPRRGRALALALAVFAVTAPALAVGFFHDDLVHRIALEGGTTDYRPGPHQLYDFVGGPVADAERMKEIGYLPWLAQDDLTLRFFRPLSSLLLAVDHALFGRDALAAHLHSLLWLIVLGWLVWRLHRRLLPKPAAGIASASYLLAGAHGTPLAWLAARHVLISATLTLGALALYLRGRRQKKTLPIAGATLLFAVGLTASETTLGLVPFVVCYELFAGEGTVRRRALSSAPIVTLAFAYLLFYGFASYGTHGSGAYLSPFDTPLAFIAGIGTRLPPLLSELYAGLPVLVWSMATPVQAALWVIGSLSFATVVWILVRRRAVMANDEKRQLLWLGTGSVGCLVPMVGTILDGRLLVVALFGSSALLASAIVHGWRAARSREGALRRIGGKAVVGLLVFGAFVVSPLQRVGLTLATQSFATAEKELAESLTLAGCDDGDHLYVLTGSDPMLALYTEQAMVFYEPERRSRFGRMRVLSMASHDHTLVGTEDGFVLAIADLPRRRTLFEEIYRRQPLEPGQVHRAGELTATVEEAEGILPLRTRFAATGPYCLLRWNGERLEAIDQPPAGEEVALPHVAGPMGL